MLYRRYQAMLMLARVAILLTVAASFPLTAAAQDAGQIVIKDYMFAPNSVTVKAGTTVKWTNKDDEPHTVVSDTALFRSGAIDTDENFSFKFDKPGTYHFTCSIHPRMVGTIVVE
jgi:plastocyanin